MKTAYTGTLTPAHHTTITTTRDQWMNTGLATHPPDHATAQTAVKQLYDAHTLPQPLLTIWMDSPLGCIYAGAVIRQLWGQLGGQLRDQLGDQLRDQLTYSLYPWNDAYWLAFYGLALPIAGLPPEPKLDALTGVITECGWFIPMRGAVILGGRPAVIRREGTEGRLHCATGPALAWADGYTLHAWHGRRVPAWVIESPDPEKIAAEANVEVRRCAIEAMGWDRFAEEAALVPVGRTPGTSQRSTELCNARVPDPGNPGQTLTLYDVPERLWGDRIRLLMCTNGSTERDGTRRRYGLTVPAHITDPLEAAAWTVGLTRDQYARTVRRT